MLPEADTDSDTVVDYEAPDEYDNGSGPRPNTSQGSSPLLETLDSGPVPIDPLLPPFKQAEAALLFMRGQLLFAHQDERGWSLKCISPDSARAAFSQTPLDSGWIDPALRRFGSCPEGPWALAYYPPARRLLRLDYENQSLELTLPMPGLVLIGLGTRYHLFALAEKFSPAAVLCQAPFPNLNAQGWICFGNSPCLPATPGNLPVMWDLIWSTRFNADWCNQRCKSEPADVRRLLLRLRGRSRFPKAELLSTRTTLEQVLRTWNSPNSSIT